MKRTQIAGLCGASLLALYGAGPAFAQAPQAAPATKVSTSPVTISDAECDRLLADENATVSKPAPASVPIWDVGATTPSQPSPMPSASSAPGTTFGPSNPVVQALPTPAAAPLPDNPAGPNAPIPVGGGGVPYMKSAPTTGMRVTTAVHDKTMVRYYRAGSISSAYQQDLSAVKTYPTPRGNGVLQTIGGQKILTKEASTKIKGLSPQIVQVIDELNLTAAALGLPDPVITAGHDTAGHSSDSDHYSGNALDLRCNTVSASACKAWVVSLSSALGPGYDVLFEDWGGANNHLHLAWTG